MQSDTRLRKNKQVLDEKIKKLHVGNHNMSNNFYEKLKLFLIPTTILLGILISWYYNVMLSSLVNKPLNEPKIVSDKSYLAQENLDRYWGTYRLFLNFFKNIIIIILIKVWLFKQVKSVFRS